MKSIDLRHRLAAVLLAVCLVVCCALPAFATSANIALGRLGSLHVRLYDTHNDVPLRGGELTLYQVAAVKRTDGSLSYAYTGDFTGCGVPLGDLSDSTLADRLAKYLPTGVSGVSGLYLVMQTEASHGYEAIKPFLVSIPLPDGDSWIYDVDATPKVGATIPDTPETPPDTPDTPPETPETPPDTPDTPPDTPDIPEQPDTPDTPVSPDSPDSPVSPDSPDNPVSPENPDNPVSPSNPDKPVLPQTGQLNWPVPVLAVSGVLLFAAGWVLNKKEALP